MNILNVLRFFNLKSSPSQISGPKSAYSYQSGINVNVDTASKVAAYYRGKIYISTQIAKLPWEIKDKSNVTLPDDAVSKILNLSPNPEMNAFSFRLTMIQNAIDHGNSYAEIERDTLGRPVALWPIASENVEPMRAYDGRLIFKIIGGSAKTTGADAYLEYKNIFHIRNFHTKDGIVGQGLIAYGADTLGIAIGADRMAKGMFANGGMPSGVIEMQGKMSKEAYDRLKESWKSDNGGRKTGGTAILEEGAKFSAISMAPELLQFLDSRKFGVLELSRFFGLPPTKLFDTGASTYNNTENANLEVATDTLDSWAKNFEIEADVKLLSNRFNGKKSEIDLYQIFRGDMKSRAEYFTKMFNLGTMTSNQIRNKEGDPSYVGGDEYYIATNNLTPISKVNALIDAEIESKKSGAKTNKAAQAFLTDINE